MDIKILTDKKRKNISPYGIYSLCFVLVSAAVFSWFFLNGKTMIWKETDGLTQHFNSLVYYRSWLRGILKNLLINHRLEIPMWNWNVGYGADVITTFHYYVLGDPLNLLSVFVPQKSMEAFYGGLIVLRIWLAGMAFLLWSRSLGEKSSWTAAGALIYSFNFWTIMAGVRHPFFMNPLIYLPLILMGIDKIFKKEKPFLFIGMTALCAVSNFYFFYMICVLMFFYAVGRYMAWFRPIRPKELLGWFLKFVFCFAVGTAVSAVILLPVALVMLNSGRAEAGAVVKAFYPALYYWKFPGAFLAGQAGYWNKMGYTALGVLAVLQLFLKRKRGGSLKRGFLFMTLLLLIPWCGHALNGFSYVTNRFVWAYGMLNGYIAARMCPELLSLDKKEKLRLGIAAGIYCGFCYINRETRTEFVLAAMVPLCFLLLFFLTAEKDWILAHRPRVKAGLFLFLCFCLILQGSYKYSPEEQDYISEFENQGQALRDLTENTPSSLLKEIEDERVWRYDSGSTGEINNSGLQQQAMRVNFYWSLADGTVNQFQREMYLNTQQDHKYDGLDGRMALEALAGVRYFLVPEGKTGYLPYGYDQLKVSGEAGDGEVYSVYENPDSLPLAYTCSSYILREDYEKMSATQKQQALLQGAVTEKAPKSGRLQEIAPRFTESYPEYTVKEGEGLSWEEGKVTVEQEGASLTISFQGMADCETYFILEGLDYEDINPLELCSEEEIASMDVYTRNKLYSQNRDWEGSQSAVLKIKGGQTEKKLKYLTRENSFSSGVEDFLVNIGCSSEAVSEIKVTFQNPGVYTFDRLYVACQPVQEMKEWIEELGSSTPKSLQLEGNRVEAEASLAEPGLLCFSIPYSRGWTAYVDGEKAEVLQVNTMNLAVELGEGKHIIELRYETPGLGEGAAISAGGLISLGILLFISRKKRKTKENIKFA